MARAAGPMDHLFDLHGDFVSWTAPVIAALFTAVYFGVNHPAVPRRSALRQIAGAWRRDLRPTLILGSDLYSAAYGRIRFMRCHACR